jgi:hypothetical protein
LKIPQEDFFTYQGRRAEGKPSAAERFVAKAPTPLEREPRVHPQDVISVTEHPASTTIVRQIRGALLKRLRGE